MTGLGTPNFTTWRQHALNTLFSRVVSSLHSRAETVCSSNRRSPKSSVVHDSFAASSNPSYPRSRFRNCNEGVFPSIQTPGDRTRAFIAQSGNNRLPGHIVEGWITFLQGSRSLIPLTIQLVMCLVGRLI